MAADEKDAGQVADLLATPGLAGALESERFRHFLDQIPVAIAVAEIRQGERIIYVNPDFEKLSGLAAAEVDHKPWSVLDNRLEIEQADRHLGSAIAEGTDYVGVYRMEGKTGKPAIVDAYSNLIEDDDGTAIYRLAALVNILDPEIIVVSGGLVAMDALLFDPLAVAFRGHVEGSDFRPEVPIVVASLGTRAGVIGAAALARELRPSP